MVTHYSKDGHPPSKIYQKEEYYRLEIWHPDLNHNPLDGHQPSKIRIYQNEVYYRLGIWHMDFIIKLRTGDNCHGWLATIS